MTHRDHNSTSINRSHRGSSSSKPVSYLDGDGYANHACNCGSANCSNHGGSHRCDDRDRGPRGPRGHRGCRGPRGYKGDAGPPGSPGAVGKIGPPGIQGKVGKIGPPGIQGKVGLIGVTGSTGPAGATGPTGEQGSTGASAGSQVSDFYAIMPGNNQFMVPAGGAVEFPQIALNTANVTSTSASEFNLAVAGYYLVQFQVSVTEPGQLQLRLNGTPDGQSVVGRATGTSQIVGMSVVTTLAANTTLEVINPAGNSGLTITPLAGGTEPVSAHLIITELF